jgi:hypothetical protein
MLSPPPAGFLLLPLAIVPAESDVGTRRYAPGEREGSRGASKERKGKREAIMPRRYSACPRWGIRRPRHSGRRWPRPNGAPETGKTPGRFHGRSLRRPRGGRGGRRATRRRSRLDQSNDWFGSVVFAQRYDRPAGGFRLQGGVRHAPWSGTYRSLLELIMIMIPHINVAVFARPTMI